MDKLITEIRHEDRRRVEEAHEAVRRALRDAGHERGAIRARSLDREQIRTLADHGCDESVATIRAGALEALDRAYPRVLIVTGDHTDYLDAGLVRVATPCGPYSWARHEYAKGWVRGLRSALVVVEEVS